MLQPGRPSLEEKPKATLLRRLGGLTLVAGLALNVSLTMMSRVQLDFRLAMLVLAPGLILLFTAFLAENTPSMRGCLTIFALGLAFVAGFWAWVGVSVALDPEGEPPAVLQGEEAPTNEAESETEDAEAPADDSGESDQADQPEEPPADDTLTEGDETEED